jgi:FKBP-type peptidyl-prolyl cis-trans isomerase (trigger factor)
MKLEVKKVDATKREMKFEVPKERVSQKLDEVYSELGKVAKIKGFRPGKIPRHVLESQHGKLAREETIKKIIPEVYQEGIAKENLRPLDMPEIHDVSFKDGIISFTAKLDIRPEVKIKNYKKIPVKRKDSKVTDEELNKTLEYFKKGQGDKEVTLDDAFARGLGYPTFEEFKNFLRRQMEMDKERHNRMDVENQVVEYLLKNASLHVPQSVVKKQLEHRLSEIHERMHRQGMPEEEIKKKETQMGKDMEAQSEKDVKAFLIMEKIAETENIHVHQNENLFQKVTEFLLKEAEWKETN